MALRRDLTGTRAARAVTPGRVVMATLAVLAVGSAIVLAARGGTETADDPTPDGRELTEPAPASDPADADSSGTAPVPAERESTAHGSPEGAFDGTEFVATFDGDPGEPQPFDPVDWDITVHSRNPGTWNSLDPVDAGHGPACEPPPEAHRVTAYEDSVFLCKNHMMTSIRGDDYGLIYLTPPYLVDFSAGEAVIKVDVSTRRESVRDWWDIWISPYDDALQLPLDLDASADLSGPPRNAIRVGLGSENQMSAEIYEDFANVGFPDWPHGSVTGDFWTGYEAFLDPDFRRRDTFEIHLSRTHLRVGMPQYDFWWIDTPIPELAWSSGVVQFGHHSYNPGKDCNVANNPKPPVAECVPNTWHWDNVEISPAAPFTIVRAEQRMAHAEAPTMSFVAPAPAAAKLRFAGIGLDMKVRFDGGPWQEATVQRTLAPTAEEHFASYWVDVPAGTTTVEFGAENWYGGSWHVRDASFWSLGG